MILVYMIHGGYCDINVDMDKILSLIAEWDSENCIGAPSKIYMR